MSDVIFGANLGSEILYNGVPYVLKETGTATRNQFSSIQNSNNTISNIERPTYSFDNTGAENSYQYPLGAEAAANKFGWKAQGIVDENPTFVESMWVSPQPITWKPKQLKLEYTRSVYNGYRYVYNSRYSVITADVNYFTAPVDGFFRIFGGVINGRYVYTTDEIVSILKHDITAQPGSMAGTNRKNNEVLDGDTIAFTMRGYINDSTPVDIKPKSFKIIIDSSASSQAEHISKVKKYELLEPVQMNAGDTFYFKYDYIPLHSDSDYGSMPDEIDITESKLECWFNGIFYPLTP